MQAMAIPSLPPGIMWLITLANASESAWNYMEYDAYQSGKMPMMDQVLACGADSGFVALGSNGKWYKSKNNGLTWAVDYTRNHASRILGRHPALRLLPRQGQLLLGSTETASVWKGRFNKDGWIKDSDYLRIRPSEINHIISRKV